MSKFLKIVLICSSFVLLNGFTPLISLLGPGITIASSGNTFKAGAQIIFDHTIAKKTGKNSFTHVKEEIYKQNANQKFNKKLRKLVKKRIKLAHDQFNLKKIN